MSLEPIKELGRAEAVTAQGAESRRAILEAAKELIGQRGYAGASVGAICERAGVARTALYWHFGSKAGLLAAVTVRVFASWNEKIQRSVSEEGDPLQRLDRLIDGTREMVLNEPSVAQLLFGVALEGESIPAAVGETMRRQREGVHRMIVEGFEESLGSGFPDLDIVAGLVLAFNHDAVLMHRFDPKGPGVERIFDQMRRAIVLIVGHRLGERLSAERPAPQGEFS